MMQKSSRLLLMLASAILFGCGSVQPLVQATLTTTVTETPTFTPTSTSTSTPQPTLTRTPNATATFQLERFNELMLNYFSFGPVASIEGKYYPLDDYSDQLAQKGYFSWSATEMRLRDFLLRADVKMATANNPSNSTGCGIVFRTVGDFNESIFILQNGELNYGAGDTIFNSRNYGKFSNPAEFEVVFVLKDNHYQLFIDGTTAMKGDSILDPSAGGIGFAVQSGSDDDFGSQCDFTNIDLWAIKEK